MSRTPIELKDPARAALLAWLVPGLGHFYQGRTRKGWLYLTCILGLYLIGFGLGEGKIVFWSWVNPMNDPEHFRLSFLGQLGVGLPAIPALIQGTLKYLGRDPILGGFMAEPTAEVLNALHPKLGKLLEVGWLYTMMAGLLNILAIFDAHAGPALPEGDAPAAALAAAPATAAVPKVAGRAAEAGA